jgi:hypothetical protein
MSAEQGVLPEDWQPDDRMVLAGTTPEIAERDPPPASTSRATFLVIAALSTLFIDALCSWMGRQPNYPRALQCFGVAITLIAIGLSIAAMIVSRPEARYSSLRKLLLITVLVVGFANYANIVLGGMTIPAGPRASATSYFYWLNQAAEIGLGAFGFFLLSGRRRES